MCTIADIPLEKTEKIRPLLQKHCKQAGALPQVTTLRTTYVSRLYESHFSALKGLLVNQPVSITADEMKSTKVQTLGVNTWLGVDALKSCCACARL